MQVHACIWDVNDRYVGGTGDKARVKGTRMARGKEQLAEDLWIERDEGLYGGCVCRERHDKSIWKMAGLWSRWICT